MENCYDTFIIGSLKGTMALKGDPVDYCCRYSQIIKACVSSSGTPRHSDTDEIQMKQL